MNIFGIHFEWYVVVIAAVILLALIAWIVISLLSSKKEEVKDVDTRTEYGNFSGLLSKEDFEVRCEDHMLEVYRQQWIMAEPGDQKDNYLLLYLATKQLYKEQDATEEEWTQEQCEARMDEIIEELSKKTGLQPIRTEMTESEFEAYFNPEADAEDAMEDEVEDGTTDEGKEIADDTSSEENA